MEHEIFAAMNRFFEEQKESLAAVMAAGRATDYADYKRMVGAYFAMGAAQQELKRLEKALLDE